MIEKNLDQIKEEDLQYLVDNKEPEKKTLEYKQSLPANTKEAKLAFLAVISSFANASGGDLIYGIEEDRDTGTPKKLLGLEIINVDEEIRRLEDLIRNGIKPRIPYFNTQPVTVLNTKKVIIIRVSKSWISPHRVTLEGHDKFYGRSSNGKYQLNVEELRIAFNLSETYEERIRRFKDNRIAKLIANETPKPMTEGAKIIFHIIPIYSFVPGYRYDVKTMKNYSDKVSPLFTNSFSTKFNLDGILNYTVWSYVQIFRNGIMEFVNESWLKPVPEKPLIHHGYEKDFMDRFSIYLDFLRNIEVGLPIFVYLTIIGVKGYMMGRDIKLPDEEMYGSEKIDRDVLLIAEVMVENYDDKAEDILKPCFDAVWNACGFPQSQNYNENGEWDPLKSPI